MKDVERSFYMVVVDFFNHFLWSYVVIVGLLGIGVGAAMMYGVRRGLFSNEAGMGSAPNAAGTAHVSHPAKQGFIQTLGVFFDTLVVCSATAFIILVSPEVYFSGEHEGINLLQASLSDQIGEWATIFIAVAIFLFAFSSIIGSYYYGETNIQFIKNNVSYLHLYRLTTMGFVFVCSIAGLGFVWEVADLFMALMTTINLVSIALLSGVAFKVIKDYEEQRKQGLDPTFDPEKLGIQNAEAWEEKSEKQEYGVKKHQRVV